MAINEEVNLEERLLDDPDGYYVAYKPITLQSI